MKRMKTDGNCADAGYMTDWYLPPLPSRVDGPHAFPLSGKHGGRVPRELHMTVKRDEADGVVQVREPDYYFHLRVTFI